MKKGFTLVEVLAVIAILGLVVAISIPKVVSTMKDSNKKAFRIDAQLVLKTIDLKLAQGLEYDITTLDVETIKSVFGINNKNFKTLSVTIENGIPYISIEGKNEWEGFLAFGSEDDVVVTEEDYVDTVAPVISLIGASQVYLEAGAMYYEVGATAIDNHDGDITNKITMQGNVVNTAVPGTYVLNYAVSDYIGNVSSVTRTVTVLANAAPTVAFGMNGNTTYAKSRSTSVTVSDNVAVVAGSLKYQWTTSTTEPTEASFTTTFTNGSTISTPAGVNGGYYLWILAKDTNNNTMIARSNVFNLDNTAPVITMTGSTPVTKVINQAYTDAGATATDNIDGVVTSRISVTSTVNMASVGTYTVTYNVSDNCGNVATAVVRTVNVITNIYDYAYTGAVQTFTAPVDGSYKIELWGAQGGNGGNGGYTVGNINLTKNTVFYVFVGGTTTGGTGGFNGGGSVVGNVYGGGGATDVRTTNGAWNDVTSLRSRIMVAGGGGGYGNGYAGGAAGGLTGSNGVGEDYGFGGTQTAGGNSSLMGPSYGSGVAGFGFGSSGSWGSEPLGAGGSGYYGGSAAGGVGSNGSGGGGSSFISGHSGCNAIDVNGAHTGQANHYSGYIFTSTLMTAGARTGNGAAKFTITG